MLFHVCKVVILTELKIKSLENFYRVIHPSSSRDLDIVENMSVRIIMAPCNGNKVRMYQMS